MKLPLLIALIWCIYSQPAYAEASGAWLRSGWQPYTGTFAGAANSYREERKHWLQSRLKFSGKTSRNSDGAAGSLGVEADRLVGQSDAVGFDYRDSRSLKDGAESSAAKVRYRFPAGANQVRLEAVSSQYDRAVAGADRRYSASGESRSLGLVASRPLFSGFGMAFDGLVRHTGRSSQSFRENSLLSESRYQRSSVGLGASGGRVLGAGLRANTRITALSGREFSATDYVSQEGTEKQTDFYKVSMSASLEQDFYQWSWKINGRYQFADEDLPSAEYLTVASPSMLAGFNGQSVSAATGGWLRLDAGSPAWQMPFMDGVLSSFNVGVLTGWVPYSGPQSKRHGQASAGQVSLRLRGRAFTANVSVGRMIRTSGNALTMPDDPDVRLSLAMGI